MDSFKVGSKFCAPFRSGRLGTVCRSVSTPLSGIAVLDRVRRWWSISLRRTPGLLREGSACLICGIRQSVSLLSFLADNTGRNTVVWKCWPRQFLLSWETFRRCTFRLCTRVGTEHRAREIARLKSRSFFFFLSFSCKFKRNDIDGITSRALACPYLLSLLARFFSLKNGDVSSPAGHRTRRFAYWNSKYSNTLW